MFEAIPINGQTWLICGGRDFADQGMFDSAMYDLTHLKGMPDKIIHGEAKGADAMAGQWAWRKGVREIAMSADWKAHGRAAGPIRNQEMLDKHKPHLVIAFPGGRGTADMVKRSRVAGVDVAEVKVQTQETRQSED